MKKILMGIILSLLVSSIFAFSGGPYKNYDLISDGTFFAKAVYGGTSLKTQNEIADKMYRTSPRENGKYYAIESSYDGGKTWHSTGDSSPSQEEANKKMEYLKKGLTTSGLTQEEAKANISEDTSTAQEEAKASIPEDTSTLKIKTLGEFSN